MAGIDDAIKEEVKKRVEAEQRSWQHGQFDFCLLHSEMDMESALEFRDSICDEHQLTGVMESDEVMCTIASEFDRIEEMINRSTKIFMFITENFDRDKMCRLQKNELLSQQIYKAKPHIIPIYMLERYLRYIPFGLTGMVGFKMYNHHKEKRRIQCTFSNDVRDQTTVRKKDEARIYAEKTTKLFTKFHIEVQNEFRKKGRKNVQEHSKCDTYDSIPSNDAVAMKSTHYTQITSAASVTNGPVFNIVVQENAVLNLDPNLRNCVSIQNLGLHSDESSDDDEKKIDGGAKAENNG